tara:strand:- start:122485 stop:122967 length:483 start_codon:yes stop_codon:yes gene_type:complete
MEEKENSVGIKLLEIREVLFSNKMSDYLVDNFDEDKLNFKLGFSVTGDKKKNIINLSVIINYLFVDKKKYKKPLEFLKLETETSFQLFNTTEEQIKFEKGSNRIFIGDDLMLLFMNSAIGATRGMLAYKIASLPINFIFPLIDVARVLNSEDLKDQIEKG